jgi:hypothetical protein
MRDKISPHVFNPLASLSVLWNQVDDPFPSLSLQINIPVLSLSLSLLLLIVGALVILGFKRMCHKLTSSVEKPSVPMITYSDILL